MENSPYAPRSIVYYNKESYPDAWESQPNAYGTMQNLTSSTQKEALATRSNTVTGAERSSDSNLDYKFIDPSSKFIGSTALENYSYLDANGNSQSYNDPFADPNHVEPVVDSEGYSAVQSQEYRPGDKFLAENGVEYIVADDYYAYPVSEIYAHQNDAAAN